MNAAVFAYGTLQIPEVMAGVTGRAFPMEDATLHGFVRFSIKGKSFPGVLPKGGSSVRGVLYHDLDVDALQRLDDFEDDYYRRQTVTVVTSRNAAVEAQVYVVEERHHPLLEGPWDFDEFKRRSLVQFLDCCGLSAPLKFAD